MDIEKIIIFSNESYFAIDKPAGVSVLEDRNSEENLLKWVRQEHPEARVCHRLDVGTSGVLLFARNDAAYRHMALALQRREVRKIYHALVHGVPGFDEMCVDLPLHVGSSSKVRVDRQKGKASSTWFRMLEKYGDHALLECRPISGRRHQIRVHLLSAGHAIVADGLYGGTPLMLSQIKRGYKTGRRAEKPLIGRSALHASRLQFEDMHGSSIAIAADYPKDFRAALRQLRKAAQ